MSRPTVARRAAVQLAAAALSVTSLAACTRGSSGTSGGQASSGAGSCPSVVRAAKAAVTKATAISPKWTGPRTGPKAATGKLIVYVAQTMTNPGVAGAAKGIQHAAAAIGWRVRIIDGQGSQAGIAAAFGQALALNPAGIVVGGFDPGTISGQVSQAATRRIPVIGWHALANPGPSATAKLFTNVTTRVSDVAAISAQYVIAKSGGAAGVVVFTDNSIPFAAGKAKEIESDLKKCSSVKILQVENIPIPDAGTRTPQEFSSLVSRLGTKWNYSIAINDLYFDNAATPLRSAGKSGGGAPYNVGAGDGSEAAFQRIRSKQFQAATVPEPLEQEGWQIVDEFNRAFAHAQPSMYVPAVHITDTSNVGSATTWDPKNDYQAIYTKSWGR